MNHYRQTDAMMTMDNFGENLVVAILCVFVPSIEHYQ